MDEDLAEDFAKPACEPKPPKVDAGFFNVDFLKPSVSPVAPKWPLLPDAALPAVQPGGLAGLAAGLAVFVCGSSPPKGWSSDTLCLSCPAGSQRRQD